MLSIKADITFIKKQKTKPYYDSSIKTGIWFLNYILKPKKMF